MGRRADYFPLVHGMRAVAALSVLLYHGAFKAYLLANPGSPLAPYAAHLDVGVPVFFLISGFLLYRPMVAARLGGDPPIDADAYGWRRVLRIVPGYWVALVLAGLAGASYAGYPEIFSKGGIGYFGFLQIYSPDTAAGGINVAWTLCVELSFYAFLPIWALGMRRLSPRGGVRSELAGLGVLFAASVAWQAFAVGQTDPNQFGASAARWLEPLPNFLDQFAVGMALAVASVAVQRGATPSWVALVRRRPALPWLGAAVAFWCLSTRLGLAGAPSDVLTPATYLARHQLNTLVAVLLLLPAVFAFRSQPGLPRLLGARPLIAAGTISYGIYLYHVPVFVRLAHWGATPRDAAGFALWLALGVSITLVLATLSWHLVERPALRRGLAALRTRSTGHGGRRRTEALAEG